MIGAIHAEGLSRLSEAAVVPCSGLHPSDAFSTEALDAASRRLIDSGLFTFNYSYAPKMEGGRPVYTVTFKVQEDTSHMVPVLLDLPGIDGQTYWSELQKQEPALQPLMPNNDAAGTYYQHSTETILQDAGHAMPLSLKQAADLRTGKMTNIFRPANAPKLMAVEFKGNQGINSALLEKTIHGIVIGRDYSAMELREVVSLNLTPLYAEFGYLRVQYGQITPAQQGDSVTATIGIDEGHTWNLGAVEIEGTDLPLDEMKHDAKFPVGRLANWKQIEQACQDMQMPLRKAGYLTRRVSEPQRVFHEDSGIVDVHVSVDKGPQFHFGELQFVNMPDRLAQSIRAVGRLPPAMCSMRRIGRVSTARRFSSCSSRDQAYNLCRRCGRARPS